MIYCLEFHLSIGSVLIPSFGITLRLGITPINGSQVSTHFCDWRILINCLTKLMLLKPNWSLSCRHILLLYNLTTMLWWRWRQLTLKLRWFRIINKTLIYLFNSIWRPKFLTLNLVTNLRHLAIENICIVIIHFIIINKSLHWVFDSYLLLLFDLFVSHLSILFSLSLSNLWLRCFGWDEASVLKHDVLHRWVFAGVCEINLILIIQIYSFCHFLHLISCLLLP